jgi:hypothetical protein
MKLPYLSLGAMLFCCSLPGTAGVVTYSSRATFNSQGTIVFNSNFDDFIGTEFTQPGDPFTRGDVTYTSGDNLIVGTGDNYSIGTFRGVMSYNFWSPITGTISTASNQYDLFGFDVAVTSGPIDITVNTNLNSYVFSGLSVPDGSTTFAFEGFQATGGEFFTGFSVATQGQGFLPGMTDVAVGTAGSAATPEPGTFSILGLAVGALVLRKKSRRA